MYINLTSFAFIKFSSEININNADYTDIYTLIRILYSHTIIMIHLYTHINHTHKSRIEKAGFSSNERFQVLHLKVTEKSQRICIKY